MRVALVQEITKILDRFTVPNRNAIVSHTKHHTILSPLDGPAAEVINHRGTAPICLVCEHASAFMPDKLDGLGVAPEHRSSHAAWDIGALSLATKLAYRLNAPLVASRVSRMVYDCNRPPEAAGAIPESSEIVKIPGNIGLTEEDRAARVTQVYEPFRNLLQDTLDNFTEPAALVTIHSFTPIWFGKQRDVELGFLHDSDDRLARRMLAACPAGLDARLNAPYSVADGVTHTLREHAIPRGLQNAMIEVRNDLVSDAVGVARFAELLGRIISDALSIKGAP